MQSEHKPTIIPYKCSWGIYILLVKRDAQIHKNGKMIEIGHFLLRIYN